VVDVDGPPLHARRIRFAFEVSMLGDGGNERGDAGRVVAFHQQQTGIRLTRDQRFRNACLLQQTSSRPNRQYRHCKPMLAIGSATGLLQTAGIPETLVSGGSDPGLLLMEGDDAAGIAAFIAAIAKHRHFERETDPPRV